MSKLIDSMNFSFSYKYYGFIFKARSDGTNVIDLSSSISDIPTDKTYYKGLKNFYLMNNVYGDCKGFLPLRLEYAKYYNEKVENRKYTEEDVQITSGASDAIISTLKTICGEGDTIIILEPFFSDYRNYCEMLGIIPCFQTVDEFVNKKIMPPRCKAVLFCNPNNPSGYILKKEELNTIFDVSKDNNLYIISDEVYSEIIYEDYTTSALYDYKKLIVIDSVSKKFNNCGARIGVVVSKDNKFMNNILKIYDSRISMSNAEQFATCYMFKHRKKIFKYNLKKFVERRNKIREYLEHQNILKYKLPSGGSFIELTLPVDSTENFAIWLLNYYRNNNRTIFILPLSSFYKNCDTKVRLTLSRHSNYIIKGLNLLLDAIQEYMEVCNEKKK